MDDLSLVGSPNELALCTAYILEQAQVELGLVGNLGKCKWFAKDKKHLPKGMEFICSHTDCVKVLGAWLGCDQAVLLKLEDELKQGRRHMERVKKVDGHEGLLILLKSMQPRWGYILRTHPPTITDTFAAAADEILVDGLCFFLGFNLTKEANMMRSLPTRYGGAGLVSPFAIRKVAYDSSLAASKVPLDLPHGEYLKARKELPSQSQLTEPIHHAVLALLNVRPEMRLHLSDAATTSSSHWLRRLPTCAPPLNRTQVGAMLQLRFAMRHPMCSNRCPGCNLQLSDTRFAAHVSGCTRIKGHNVSSAHADFKRGMRSIARHCGVTVDPTEPSQYDIPEGETKIHPDIRFRPLDKTPIVVDVGTTAGVLFASNSPPAGIPAILKREKDKEKLYKEMVESNGECFLPVIVSALGSITATSEPLWNALAAEHNRMQPVQVRDEISFYAARARADALLKVEETLGAPHRVTTLLHSPPKASIHVEQDLENAFSATVLPEYAAFAEQLFITPHLSPMQRLQRGVRHLLHIPAPILPHVEADLSDDPSIHQPTPSRWPTRLMRRVLSAPAKRVWYASLAMACAGMCIFFFTTEQILSFASDTFSMVSEMSRLIASSHSFSAALSFCLTGANLGYDILEQISLFVEFHYPQVSAWLWSSIVSPLLTQLYNIYVGLFVLVACTAYYLHRQRILPHVLLIVITIVVSGLVAHALLQYILEQVSHLPSRAAQSTLDWMSRSMYNFLSFFSASPPTVGAGTGQPFTPNSSPQVASHSTPQQQTLQFATAAEEVARRCVKWWQYFVDVDVLQH